MRGSRPSFHELSPEEEYRIALKDLTFNSKPIINDLSILAHEYIKNASGISTILADYLLNCVSDVKLPTLYLIDSICKNIGEPYIGYFTNLLPSVIPEIIRRVRSEGFRRDVMRTVQTWWGIFPDAMCRSILPKNVMVDPVVNHKRSFDGELRSAAIPPPPPSATIPSNILQMLIDLRQAVNVPPQKYNQKYVAEIMYHLEQSCQMFDPLLFVALDERARLSDKRPLIQLIDSLTVPPIPPSQYSTIAPPVPPLLSPVISPPVEIAPPPPVVVPDVSALLASLSPNLFTQTSPISAKVTTIRPVYEDIIKSYPDLHQELYSQLPRQCPNCALRFPNTTEGQVSMQTHLDAHFRKNMRFKDKAKKFIARLWLQPEHDWINNVEVGETEKSVNLFATSSSTTLHSNNNVNIDLNEYIVEAGNDHEEKYCSLCKELIPLHWDDDKDQWVYQNTVKKDNNTLVHATCNTK